ncbi:MAG TPA: hypothetical protein GXX18_18725 [Bacillales bacterium]|nr:hypothetical protein [Bacillales bacterium]
MFNFYVGIDPITGKKLRTTRRGRNSSHWRSYAWK